MKKTLLILLTFINLVVYSQHQLPNVKLKNLKGELVNTNTDFQKKDILYVYSFWATWCAPCVQELDAISDVYGDWKQKLNVEIIAVSVDDSRTEKRVKPMINGKGWEYTVLLDTNQEFKRSLSIANVPYTVVVKNNEIVFVQNGHSPGGESEFFDKLKSL
ncbi:MAG: TlpA disulfide reductase family protein [Flavobacterium sp.]|jgi:peroxiredoxin|nr:TlpA disulfide reductase family protein [Flavobacterium sp.]